MAFSVLSVVVIALLLHSERFHNYLLRAAQQKATEVLGSRAQMRDFAIHWTGISPTVDLYGIVIHGAAPYSDPPLLQADALHVGLTVTSLLHKAWYVSDVRIERPVVRIFADRDGHTNLPSPPQTKENKSQQSINIFDLGIRHLLLERGEIYYNDRKSDLSADLHDLSLQSGFEILKQATPGRFHIETDIFSFKTPIRSSTISMRILSHLPKSSSWKVPSSELGTRAWLLSPASMTIHSLACTATYEGTVDAGEFRDILKNPSLPDRYCGVDWIHRL